MLPAATQAEILRLSLWGVARDVAYSNEPPIRPGF